MDPDELRYEIREALDSRLVPSPGLETRVLAALPPASERLAFVWPRPAVLVALLLAAAVAGSVVLVARSVRTSPAGPPPEHAGIGLAQFTAGGSGWAIASQFTGQTPNFAVTVDRTEDGGVTWREQLRLNGFQPGLRADPDGQHAVAWISSPIPCPATPAPRSRGTCSQGSLLEVYQTRDAGRHWTVVSPFTRGEVGTFSDTTHGWALTPGVDWSLSRTVDGGRTWTAVGKLPVSPQGIGPSTLTFTDPETGWLLLGQHNAPGHTGLLVTRDGGMTWGEVTMPASAVNVAWQMAEGPPAVVGGGHGMLVLGAHQVPALAPASAARRATPSIGPAVDFLDTTLVSTTADGGRTWSAPRPLAPSGAAPSLTGADFVLDARHWWLTTVPWTSLRSGLSSTLYVTADGGATWKTYRVPRLQDLWFVDDREGWAVSLTGPRAAYQVLHTMDGGVTWTRVTTPPDPVTAQTR